MFSSWRQCGRVNFTKYEFWRFDRSLWENLTCSLWEVQEIWSIVRSMEVKNVARFPENTSFCIIFFWKFNRFSQKIVIFYKVWWFFAKNHKIDKNRVLVRENPFFGKKTIFAMVRPSKSSYSQTQFLIKSMFISFI